MQTMRTQTEPRLKPATLLQEVRRSVSEILKRPLPEGKLQEDQGPLGLLDVHKDHAIFKPDQKILALWAADCAERVLPFFEEKYPNDNRPRKAIEAVREWTHDKTAAGEAHFKKSRTAAGASNDAARGKKEQDAKYAAYSAAQAAATAHVPTHALGSSLYAIKAVVAHSGILENGQDKERKWQLERLRKYTRRRGA